MNSRMDIKQSIADILYFVIILAAFFLYGSFKYNVVVGMIFDAIIIVAGTIIISASHLIAHIWDRLDKFK